jgi:hypothetical protein
MTDSPLESRLQPAPDWLKPGLQQMQRPSIFVTFT